MAIGTIPPWLNVQPAQFQQAYESGARHGLQLSELRDRRQRALEEMQSRAAERAAALEERRKEHEAESGLAREKLASMERIASDRQSAMDDYRGAQLDMVEARIGLQKSGLDLAREKADAAAKSGDERTANALTSLDFQRQRLELAKERLEDARNKPAKEPTVTLTEEYVGMPPKISRSGPASTMEPFLPKPAPQTALEPSVEQGPGMLGRMRDFIFRPPIGKGPIGPDVLGPVLDFRESSAKPGVHVRRKTDGKTFNYKGSREDVPLDSYEILE